MKEHESRLVVEYDLIKFYDGEGKLEQFYKSKNKNYGYIDSKNFLHNLEGYAWIESSKYKEHYIHGRKLTKEEWDIERNRILMLEEL